MKKRTIFIISGFVFFILLPVVGVLSYPTITRIEAKRIKKAEKKEARNERNYITAKEAFEGSVQKQLPTDSITCLVGNKEKMIPGNVDQKAEGGMLTCKGYKYRVYIGNDQIYNSMNPGIYDFKVRLIKSNRYYLYVDTIRR